MSRTAREWLAVAMVALALRYGGLLPALAVAALLVVLLAWADVLLAGRERRTYLQKKGLSGTQAGPGKQDKPFFSSQSSERGDG